MATCERVVKKPVPPPVEYVLRLTEREAVDLRRVLDRNYQCAEMDGIVVAMSNAGVRL